MVGYHKFVALVATIAGLAIQPVLADQKPSHMCPSPGSNLVNGFRTECDMVSIKGLKGHTASQILYEIIAESTLSNGTFFRNGSHVTCLFQETSFALNGAGIGLGLLEIQIPEIKYDKALCLFVADVPQGGLNLGEKFAGSQRP
ncbi:hypothetical protein B0T18DRAFT_200417 [Schizothecium vesticola]|uniref:Uncharacterized protein n=1 Tax=Schizothecium vesticola TaxID=314040 RepID=A0AA40ERL2_9PEZI|nr:hypothetical protein B0T18DRAFT_200417 [Schizothecium vesticola]